MFIKKDSGVPKEALQSYLDYICWKLYCKNCEGDYLSAFLNNVQDIYTPNQKNCLFTVKIAQKKQHYDVFYDNEFLFLTGT